MILIKALLCALIYLEEEIMSTAHNNANIEDVAKVVLMPGDPLRAKLIAENFLRMPYYLMMYEACLDIQVHIKENVYLSWEAEWEWPAWEFIRMNFLNSMM